MASRRVLDRLDLLAGSVSTAGKPVEIVPRLVSLFECRLLLGVDELSVDDDVEDAAASLDQLGLDPGLFADPGRQTGGLRLEVFDRRPVIIIWRTRLV